MTITLNLPNDLESRLVQEASQRGMALPDYVLALLANGKPSGMSGSELVAYWKREQLIGSRADIQDSQLHARDIRTQAERRRRS